MALAIVNGASANPGQGTPITTTYTNSSACVMILQIETRGKSAGFCPVTSITDSAGVTWTRRNQIQFVSSNFSGVSGGVNHVCQEIWWANITAAHASAVTITINLGSIANQQTSTTINQFQVTGSLVPATPWDVNGAAFAQQTYTNGSTSQNSSAGWTVSSSAACVLAFQSEMGASGSTSTSAANAGYTNITGTGISLGNSTTGIARISVASKLGSSGSGTAGYTASSNIREYEFYVDALTSDSTGTALAAGTASGTISQTLTKASISAVGAEKFTGTISQALTKASISAVGVARFIGTISTALTKASISAVGAEKFTGTITTALTKASISATGAATFIGTISTALTKVSQSLSGAERFTGTITTALTKASQSLSGTEGAGVPSVSGGITTSLTKASLALVGIETLTAAIATALSRISQSASGTETFTGTITTDLSGSRVSVQATTMEVFSGTITTKLAMANFLLVGEEQLIGSIVTRLGNASGQIIANEVQATVIIEGPIIMALPPFRPLLLAAQLGSPGEGKWFSWRYTDA